MYFSTLFNLKLAEKLKNEAGTELLQKTTSFRYDNNGNELRRSVEYIALYSKTNPKAYEAAVYNEDTTEPIHAVVEQTISQYDGFNRLKKTEIIKGGVKTAVEYAYNGDGLRVEKTVRRSDKGNTAETTSYLYDRQHVILETRGSESIRYARGINYIARIDNTDKLSYFMYNGHGDVVQTVSEDGEIENRYDYDIFGNPTLTVENYQNSIRYAGEFYDSETGLYYLRARYYDAYIGRFISEDSYWGEDANPLSLNLYTYAHNNPIKYIDPTGHSAYEQGKQQVANQVKNESQQSMKDKLNAQRSSYESAVKNNDKKGAALYKGRMDALNDMLSSSGSSSSSGGRSSGGSSSGGGSSSSSGGSSGRSSSSSNTPNYNQIAINMIAQAQVAAALTGRESAQTLIDMINAQKLSYTSADAGGRTEEAELYHQRAEVLREALYEVEARNGRDISDIVNARGNDAGTWERYSYNVAVENAVKDGVIDEREITVLTNRATQYLTAIQTGRNGIIKDSGKEKVKESVDSGSTSASNSDNRYDTSNYFSADYRGPKHQIPRDDVGKEMFGVATKFTKGGQIEGATTYMGMVKPGPTLMEAAIIAENIYSGEFGDGALLGEWKLVDNVIEDGSLRMGVYGRIGADGKPEYVIANAGTELTSLLDWRNNILQPIGRSDDMLNSIEYAKRFADNNPDANITFVGHSKGGAEAAANSVATNKNAILFNPATVNLDIYKLDKSKYTREMTAYIVEGEVLNNAFDLISEPIGRVVNLPSQYNVHTSIDALNVINSVRNHFMDAVKKAIKEWEGEK